MPSREFIQSRTEMEQILGEEVLGYLGMALDDQVYVVPLNYVYTDGKILFHCALEGQKLDYIRANPQVCFTVGRQHGVVRRHAAGGVCHVDNDSVICTGTARIVEDIAERKHLLDVFNQMLQPGAEEISLEAAAKCAAVEIRVREMTGRQEREAKRIYWRVCLDV